jgi:hypothetical protein
VRVGNGNGQLAHARLRLGKACELDRETVELRRERFLGGIEQAPDLLAAFGVVLAQAAQVALGQALHQLLDLVLAQVTSQQRDALALVSGLEDVGADKKQRHQRKNFHECVRPKEKRGRHRV